MSHFHKLGISKYFCHSYLYNDAVPIEILAKIGEKTPLVFSTCSSKYKFGQYLLALTNMERKKIGKYSVADT